ncbi:hypothetical protein L798_15425 [Zootermopsis nevadensis]|uniref:Uncharacterized protein n=1 Tax=Zootermopsis nevadensis TaxID=136037 RepID=A0A067QWK6_ZOONE|nr:hypothetical protein L798_15425 [Zootermopsis nevadensis]
MLTSFGSKRPVPGDKALLYTAPAVSSKSSLEDTSVLRMDFAQHCSRPRL